MLREKVDLLVKKLIGRNVKPLKVTEWSEFADPCIHVTESIYVQIGIDYVMVVRDRFNDLVFYDASESIDDVLMKLKQAIDEGKPNL